MIIVMRASGIPGAIGVNADKLLVEDRSAAERWIGRSAFTPTDLTTLLLGGGWEAAGGGGQRYLREALRRASTLKGGGLRLWGVSSCSKLPLRVIVTWVGQPYFKRV
jgi:hypothetical protein